MKRALLLLTCCISIAKGKEPEKRIDLVNIKTTATLLSSENYDFLSKNNEFRLNMKFSHLDTVIKFLQGGGITESGTGQNLVLHESVSRYLPYELMNGSNLNISIDEDDMDIYGATLFPTYDGRDFVFEKTVRFNFNDSIPEWTRTFSDGGTKFQLKVETLKKFSMPLSLYCEYLYNMTYQYDLKKHYCK